MNVLPNSIEVTADLSPTLRSGRFGVTYHSKHGAWTETNHIFIQHGLKYISAYKNVVDILEIGFGTGLNCLASILFAKENNLAIHYTAIEPFPISQQDVAEIKESWMDIFLINETELFSHIHCAAPFTQEKIFTGFTLLKEELLLSDFEYSRKYDLIYFDAFAPECQPELWTLEVFENLYDVLKEGGILVTYCAKGYVKRNLKDVGFDIESLPGPPGKREMTRAKKSKVNG